MVEYGLTDFWKYRLTDGEGEEMLRIAICDDDLRELSRISGILNQYQVEREPVFKYDVFSNAIDLVDAMKRKEYHILLLDVLMPGLNGIQAAREIRGFDEETKIIFLTSSSEFAVESYAVDAHYYMLKPGTAQKLFPVLDKIFLELQRGEDVLQIKTASGFTRIPFNRIECLEVFNKKLRFHLVDGTVKEINGSLSSFEDMLSYREEFIKVHRSYIVNMQSIVSLSAKEITTSAGQAVPISRLLYNEVREAYMQYLFEEKGVK
ncbi:MAG: LytTR family DNA-binding domain-containing protein [Eubacteriales bacterium]|nr:LytTR family DNA-binding domain-containing protein [Eubacteriales bacterium]